MSRIILLRLFRDAAVRLVVAGVALFTPPAHAELLEFNATLSIESIATLFPPAPGQNSGPSMNTVSPGHGFASVSPAGGISGFQALTGLSGTVRVGDLGTDATQDFWEVEIEGVSAPAFTGVPLHGPMALFVGDALHRRVSVTQTSSTQVATFLRTRGGSIGIGLGGFFSSSSPPPNEFSFTAEFGTWTTGALTLTDLQYIGPTSPTTAGFDQRTAGGLGFLQLVTPIRHETAGSSPLFPAGNRNGAFARLRLEFVPEPARFVMFAWGASLLFFAARQRARR